jgi:transposase
VLGAGGAYDLGYHVVWCPKYRRAVLTGPVRGRLDTLIRAKCGEDQARWSFSSQQATLRRLDKAFVAFFRRARVGERSGYPRFKGAGWFDTVEWPKDGDGCRWDSQPDRPTTRVRLQGVGHVKVHRHRPVAGRVKTVSVKREGRRWYVVLSCDDVPRPGQFLSNGQTAKSGLNRSILDAGWGAFVNVLRAKAESAGRVIVEVDARHTSQPCAARGRVAAENRVVQARFCCVACGHRDHADVNGAVNILRAGLARQADAQAA